jgi:hypothetical protein
MVIVGEALIQSIMNFAVLDLYKWWVNLKTLFGKKCKTTDEQCEVENGIIIWKYEEIKHDCPYEEIDTLEFERYEENIMTAKYVNLAFEISVKIQVCQPNTIEIYTSYRRTLLIVKTI